MTVAIVNSLFFDSISISKYSYIQKNSEQILIEKLLSFKTLHKYSQVGYRFPVSLPVSLNGDRKQTKELLQKLNERLSVSEKLIVSLFTKRFRIWHVL